MGPESKSQSDSLAGVKRRHPARQQVGKRRFLDRDDCLPPTCNKLRQNFREIDRTEVIYVLDRIIKQDRLSAAPCERQSDGKQEGQTSCAALAAREEELRVDAVTDLQRQGSPHVPVNRVRNILLGQRLQPNAVSAIKVMDLPDDIKRHCAEVIFKGYTVFLGAITTARQRCLPGGGGRRKRLPRCDRGRAPSGRTGLGGIGDGAVRLAAGGSVAGWRAVAPVPGPRGRSVPQATHYPCSKCTRRRAEACLGRSL